MADIAAPGIISLPVQVDLAVVVEVASVVSAVAALVVEGPGEAGKIQFTIYGLRFTFENC